jgi:Protein of unknown function (DUF3570)
VQLGSSGCPTPLGSPPPSPLRERLSKAALALLLMPAAAMADSTPANQVDYTALYYGEQGRTEVFEPVVRATRLFGDGQSLSAQLAIDVITGASPSGALPSGSVQTITSASGRVITVPAGEIPTTRFQDHRFGLDGEWHKPWGRLFSSTFGLHASREKDYQSFGVNGKISADLLEHTFTVTAGGGYSDDSVFPVGGTPIGLSDGTEVTNGKNPKHVSSLLFGLSHVLTRRWMMSLDGTRTVENGYLTEPYKVISLVDPFTGIPDGQLTDKRPSTRTRTSALLSSVYHLKNDIAYTSYRYYWDSWGIRSNTLDLRYRHDLEEDDWYLEPHIRLYRQSKADFFTVGLSGFLAPPDFATSDYRLGKLTTLTLGTTFAFRLGWSHPALWTLRAEYIRQFGDSSPPDAIGVQRTFDLSPPINTFTAVIGYSFNF